MTDAAGSFAWIVGILRDKRAPFQITGGLAAKVYGSTRALNDIDIDLPDVDLLRIAPLVQEHAVFGPARFVDERWDCLLMTLNRAGQEIDLCGADSMRINDARIGEWRDRPSDLSRASEHAVFGLRVPVIPPQDLIDYKRMLVGGHQQVDIAATEEWMQNRRV